jgi:hypothetical protein
MSTDPSKDPIPYRKDLRKKMDMEEENSENDNGDQQSGSNKEL